MTDPELVKKMLRAVLQSNKNGVTVSRLQADFRILTGDIIPYRQMGHSSMEGFLRSVPSVVRMERDRSGETVCFAAVCKETAHIAQLVARQRNSNKAGRSQLVNCQLRVKPCSPFTLTAKPRTSLRQPERMGLTSRTVTRQTSLRPTSSHGSMDTPRERVPTPPSLLKEVSAHVVRSTSLISAAQPKAPPRPQTPSGSSSRELVQEQLKQLLQRYGSGVWLSKVAQVYRDMFREALPAHALNELYDWPHICSVERPGNSNIVDSLVYPALTQTLKTSTSPPATPQKPPPTLSLCTPSPSPTSRPSVLPKLPVSLPPPRPPSPLTPKSPAGSTSTAPGSPLPTAAVPCDTKPKLRELLGKYCHGLWAHALPQLFQEAYKAVFPQQLLENLEVLADTCVVQYPMPGNRRKAILYALPCLQSPAVQSPPAKQLLMPRPGNPPVPPLRLPKEEHPSVLVMSAGGADTVVLRFIGEAYSQAQESMEDAMVELYGHQGAARPLMAPVSGQLAAVCVEDGELLRAQVRRVAADGVKVYYLDHGYSEVVDRVNLLELDERFLTLPFQATSCTLAGLEPFGQDPEVLRTLEALACGRILLAEILGRGEAPLVVLYDTSQDDDVNINAECLKTLQDKSMDNPLLVNSTYMNVSVTNVCSDGTIFCQMPSRGQAKLKDIFDKIEAYFISQVTSGLLVSLPFCGKICLARYKGKWSRVEITNLHESRVLDIRFLDLGLPASVEVTELREIPPPFLRDILTIPPQAIRCWLAGLSADAGRWTPDATLWLRDTVLGTSDCSMQIAKLDEAKLVHIYLFPSSTSSIHPDGPDPADSLNHQLLSSDLWRLRQHRHGDVPGTGLPLPVPARLPEAGDAPPPAWTRAPGGAPSLPRPLELPAAGQNLDAFVSVACHPGHFVLQPWQEMYKLMVLMGEMILYYNHQEAVPARPEKNQIYAAKVDNDWHRVLVKGVLTNGLVAIYELDYGKHELIGCSQLRPLIDEFLQLPFQGIPAQLAGVRQTQWSEEASMVFRNHVERKALVAQMESVQEATHPWDRKAVVYLVDTGLEDRDVWVHDVMAEFVDELSRAA